MNKKSYILTALAALLFTTGCVDLDYTEAVTRDEKWTYDSPIAGIKSLVFDVYALMGVDNEMFSNYGGGMLASATDEAEFATSLSDIHKYYDGGWTPSYSFGITWITSYRAIAEVHMYMERLDKINLDEYKYADQYESWRQQFELFPYELRFLRAYFYFQLAKTYGDVPLVTSVLTNQQANTIHRTPVQDVFRFIISELDAIAPYLPVSYMDVPGQEIGRANRAAAMALKARAALYAASPLFNPDDKPELWEQAAAASKAVIDAAAGWGITLSAYADLWGPTAFTNPEVIFSLARAESNQFEMANYPVGVENGNSGNCPTQSLVDAYEYQDNGETFKQRYPQNVNLSEVNPYEGLDPRFALTVVKNGDMWPTNAIQSKAIETYFTGANALPLYGGTPTGYYLRKLVNGNAVTTYNNPSGFRSAWIVMRLAEFYLNYAEAMYNLTGSATSQGEFGMSANEAINVLRNRADIAMPLFEGNDGFEERYIRERMVELAFEGHRFWDVRRWKMGSKFFTSISVASLTKANNGVITLTRSTKNRGWNEKYNLHPIMHTERQKNPNLGQNPGWEN
jgi:hypothetical protein